MRWMLLALLLLAPPARAQELALQLALAVDASGSVSRERFELQKQGYAAAFRNPRLVQAIAGSEGVAVAMFQWTGPGMQADVVPWRVVRDRASAEALAAAIEAAPRQLFSGGTSISGAIDHAMALFRVAPGPAQRRVIDISGDGANNRGRPAARARDEAVAEGVTINGLPILNVEPDLDEHYRDEVIGGPGAFMIAIDGYDRFAEAILRKLLTEISARPAGRLAGR